MYYLNSSCFDKKLCFFYGNKCEGLCAAFVAFSPHNPHLAWFWVLCSGEGWVDVVLMWDVWVHLERECGVRVKCSVPHELVAGERITAPLLGKQLS